MTGLAILIVGAVSIALGFNLGVSFCLGKYSK